MLRNLSHRSLIAFFAIVMVATFLCGVLDPLLCYDPWAYHLRFAASLWNIGGSADHTILNSSARREGFAMVANWFQGFFWAVFGSVNFVFLANFLPFCGVLACARRWFRADIIFIGFSLLAMPLVALHISSAYIDLFVGCMIVLQLMAAIRLRQLVQTGFADKKAFLWALGIFLIAGSFAANAKFQAVMIVIPVCLYTGYLLWRESGIKLYVHFNPWIIAGVGLGFCLLLIWSIQASPRAIFWIICFYGAGVCFAPFLNLFACSPKRYDRLRFALLICALTAVLASTTNIKNLIRHNNPVYPIEVSLAGDTVLFAGEEKTKDFLLGKHYALWYRPFYFFISMMELDYLLHPLPKGSVYSEASQYAVYRDEESSNRSGGLFGALVWLQLWLFAGGLYALSRRGPLPDAIRESLNYFILLTMISMWIKHGHELRYSFAWPIMLCFINGLMLRHGLQDLWPRTAKIAPWLALALLVFVQTCVPLQRHLWPGKIISYYPSAVKARLNPDVLDALRNHQFPCIYDIKQPYDYDYFGNCDVSVFAYSSAFTAERYPFAFTFDSPTCKPKQ